MRCGTLVRFAEANGLNEEQVRDYLRGRSGTARGAVAKLLGVDPEHLILSRAVPVRGVITANEDTAHGLSAEAK